MSSDASSTERNLLFGILALRSGFIDRDALLDGLNNWVSDQKARPLGQILVERGELEQDDEALLDALVAQLLQKFDNDPQKSLAALSSIGSVHDDLSRIADPVVQASLARVSAAGKDRDDPFRTVAPSSLEASIALSSLGSSTSAGTRFRVLRPHAEGGLGDVFVAHDTELNRDVALKQIKSRFADDPTYRARFEFEAEITGGLEHPGIVPVYGLGQTPDGRPFYAMRFIHGESLKVAIRRFHAADHQPDRDPTERMLALRGLLGRFLDVCDTVAYAHGRGVLHRDLKPSNIMLGRYGQTLVVDWGLAKAMDRPEVPAREQSAEPPLRPSSGRALELTKSGSAVGTPPYMSPEQTAGRLDQLGLHSDVYSLGATLYHLLTGHAPCEVEESGELYQKVLVGDIPRPRMLNPRIAPALEVICRKAMALKPDDRYASVEALQADVERWLADEPVSAWREPLSIRVRRWMRGHRQLVAAAAALVLASTAALAVGTILLRQANAQIERQRREALTNLAQAERNYALARDAVERYYTKVSEDRLLNEPHMERLRKELLETSREFYRRFVDERAGDPRARADLGGAYARLAKLYLDIGRSPEALTSLHRALEIQEKLLDEHPDVTAHRSELAKLHNDLGVLYGTIGRSAEAESSHQRGLEIQEKLAAEYPEVNAYRSDLAHGHNNLGRLYRATGRPVEAEASYRHALKVEEKLAAEHPEVTAYRHDLAVSHNNMGNLYGSTGRPVEAESSYRRALEIQEKLAAEHPEVTAYRGGLAMSHNSLGAVYEANGRPAEAESSYRHALVIRQKLAAEHPEVTAYRRDLADSYSNLCYPYSVTGRTAEAEASYRHALEIRQALAAEHPEIAEYRGDLAKTQLNLGLLYGEAGRRSAAESLYRQALEIFQNLAGAHPEQIDLAVALGVTEYNMGSLMRDSSELQLACTWYARAVATLQSVLRREPRHTTAREALRNTREGRASALTRLGRYADALAEWDLAIELDHGSGRDRLRLGRANTLAQSGDHVRATAEADALADVESIPDGERFYNLACVDALASAAALDDGALVSTDRSARAERLAARAVQRLARAGSAGYFASVANLANLKTDRDLDSLRPRADFQALVMDLAFPADPFDRSTFRP